MNHLRHQKYKNKQLNKSPLELENNFKPIKISINDMDKFTKKRLFLIYNYISEPIKKSLMGLRI